MSKSFALREDREGLRTAATTSQNLRAEVLVERRYRALTDRVSAEYELPRRVGYHRRILSLATIVKLRRQT